MSKEKQIDEIKNIIDDAWGRYLAEDLYDAGYRKQNDIVKCENCVNCTVLGHCKILTSKNGAPNKVNANDFCSWGIKKD